MPKSKNRGGKKAHKKRVKNRNKQISDLKNRQEKFQRAMYDQLIQQYESQTERENKEEQEERIEGIDGPEL